MDRAGLRRDLRVAFDIGGIFLSLAATAARTLPLSILHTPEYRDLEQPHSLESDLRLDVEEWIGLKGESDLLVSERVLKHRTGSKSFPLAAPV